MGEKGGEWQARVAEEPGGGRMSIVSIVGVCMVGGG